MCSKVPTDGRIMKDCVPKHEAPSWYVHLQENMDFQGCNGGHCYCDDRDGCNVASLRYLHHTTLHCTGNTVFFFRQIFRPEVRRGDSCDIGPDCISIK